MKTIIIISALLLLSFPLSGQLSNTWSVADGGGGKSAGGSFALQSSVGQSAAGLMVHIDSGKVIEGGYIPGLRSESGYWMVSLVEPLASWNLISPPVRIQDMRPSSIYPAALTAAYTFTGSYIVEDTLKPGNAYWIKFSTPPPAGYQIQGSAVLRETVFVFPGWTMIGSLSFPLPVSMLMPLAPVTFTSVFYGYGGAYFVEDTLKPGKGYWVKTSNPGYVVLPYGATSLEPVNRPIVENDDAVSSPVSAKSQFATLSIEDDEGRKQSLQFSPAPYKGDLSRFELPPVPPEGLDVRFASGRFAEAAVSGREGKQTFPLRISGGKFPVTLRWDKPLSENGYLEVAYQGEKPKQYSLAKGGEVTIDENDFINAKIVVLSSAAKEMPKVFALHQNYPNPFNPTTKIRYDVPKSSRVTLKVFNLIGQEVLTLVDAVEEPGFKTVSLDASGLASGIYFYKLQSDETNLTKKFMLIR